MQIVGPIADVRSGPTPDASLDTQALCGERVIVYEEHEGWAWGQLERILRRVSARAFARAHAAPADASRDGFTHLRLSRAEHESAAARGAAARGGGQRRR